MSNGRLSPASRAAAMARLAREEYDVLVIGGGVTGAGAALDAATRGLKVALVEMRDYAAGTSSRSGKLIHGGLRYLEQLELGLVRESLRERRLLFKRLAPHLLRPIRFLYPLRHRVWERAYLGAGLILYDTIGGAGAVPPHRHLSRAKALALAPGLASESLVGAVTFYDTQFDDSRHTLELVRTAVAHGADAASAVKVVGFDVADGRVRGVTVQDLESGGTFGIRARHVVNATGVWTDRLHALAGRRPRFSVKASKGVHIMVPKEKIPSAVSLFVRAEDSVLFVRSWGRHWLIGTTDTGWDGGLDHPAATSTDIDYLLRNVNAVLRVPIGREDIDGVFAGLRPLIRGDAGTTSALSRSHAVETFMPGLTTVTGGKYTTYRVMAADAIDAAVAGLGRAVPPSRTAHVPTVGAAGYREVRARRAALAASAGLPVERVERLLRRYGSLTEDLVDLIADRPELGRPIEGAPGYLMAEAVYAVTHEGALHIDDVLARRTHISIEYRDRGVAAARAVAPVIGAELGWDADRVAEEVDFYRARVEAELAAQRLPDDESAEAVRNRIKDPRLRVADGERP
ncbi:glycerol-3-phosphate dehydrogenase/oxidase [Thermostaphylospora chromogena]|uniref:Glycerol-3-phosphate dehydrogenase n=1 Tax=Thermostaphylospora chromogena TaxID=35622 RepID=A0A1H1GSA3_9ACTN|nr:glycerol-3-phosphate dehydrogenase/oxidase [Thermostaphylospora chromogena]SDR16019.1 glycerol-3-phosphate dehydrogenase [Thermostaphylospora chromogena]